MLTPTVASSFVLLADGEWVGIVIFAVIAAVRFLAYLVGGNKQQQPGKAARPRANPPRPARPPQAPQPQGGGGKQREEIEEFLRRVAARRQGAPVQDVEVLAPQKPAAGKGPITVAEVVEEFPAGQTVDAHVRQHMDTTKYDQRAADMAHEVDTADEEMDEHLHEVFDHDVGLLKSSGQKAKRVVDAGPTGTPPQRAASVVGHLNDTASIRDAIIVSEVLRRPVERW